VYFGNTFEDDYKSELFLCEFLKDKLLNENKKLREETQKVIDEIYKDDKNNKEYYDFTTLVSNEPLKAWRILEQNGYDLDLQLVMFKSVEEATKKKLSKADFNKFTNLIVLDICKESILSPSFNCSEAIKRGDHQNVQREIRYLWSMIRYLNKQLCNSIYLMYCLDATSRGSLLGDTFSLSRLLSKYRIIIH
jgi:hypothetical protein